MHEAFTNNRALRQSLKTGLLTAALLAFFVLVAANLRISTAVTPRTDDGGYGEPIRRTLAVTEIWSLLLDGLPMQLPGPLERGSLLLLLAVASVAFAYALAAALRLPNAERANAERGTRNAEHVSTERWVPAKRRNAG